MQSQTSKQIVSNLSALSNEGPIYVFLANGHADMLDGWRLLLTKAGDVETNPCPTTSHTNKSGCVIAVINKYMLGS